jgi:hypothetical protein
MGQYTRYALYVAILSGAWLSFKYTEPTVFPVVTEFSIEEVQDVADNTLRIKGSFNKVRDCRFIEVIGYSGDINVAVVFERFTKTPTVSRLVREQKYGPWLLIPKVSELELYSRHSCVTGEVLTKLFDGAIVL